MKDTTSILENLNNANQNLAYRYTERTFKYGETILLAVADERNFVKSVEVLMNDVPIIINEIRLIRMNLLSSECNIKEDVFDKIYNMINKYRTFK